MRKPQSRLYKIWINMRRRCYNKNRKEYHYYGGKGISVCDEWNNSFYKFQLWSLSNGYHDTLSIDRINVNGNYEPNNCRWATIQQQNLNKSSNRKFTIFNETKTMREWAEDKRCKTSIFSFEKRIHRGWNAEKALVTPIMTQFIRKRQ